MSEQRVEPQVLTDAQRIHLELVWEVLDDLANRHTPGVFTNQDQRDAREALADLLILMGFSEEVHNSQRERDDDIIDDEFEGDPSWTWTLPEEYRD